MGWRVVYFLKKRCQDLGIYIPVRLICVLGVFHGQILDIYYIALGATLDTSVFKDLRSF